MDNDIENVRAKKLRLVTNSPVLFIHANGIAELLNDSAKELFSDILLFKGEINSCDIFPEDVCTYFAIVSEDNVIPSDLLEFKLSFCRNSRILHYSTIVFPATHQSQNGKGWQVIMQDITQSHNDESEILRIVQIQDFMLNFSNYLYSSLATFKGRMQNILGILGKFIEAERIYVFEDYGNGRLTRNTFEWCAEGIIPHKSDYQRIAYKLQIPELKTLLIKNGMIMINENQEIPPELYEIVKNIRAKSILVFPLTVFDEFYGFIGFHMYSERRNWEQIDISFLKTLSLMLSNAFEREKTDEELMAREIRFKDLFNHSSDAILIYDYHGMIIEINQRACEMLGYDRQMLIGENVGLIFHYSHALHETIKRTGSDGNIYNFDSEFKTADGDLYPVEISNRSIVFENKLAVISVARDISERKQMQREILSAIIQTEEKERGRIARDLHDGLGPLLSSLKMYTKVLENSKDEQKRAEMYNATNEVIDESILLIKEIINNLSPHVLNDFGLASAIQAFCKKITLANTIKIAFDSNVFDQRFPSNIEAVLFRVLKELVNNTIKHALASNIEIFLLRTDKILTLIYSDNGMGFDIKKMMDNKSGMGLSNIISRISSINGKFLFDSLAGKGIQVKIEVDLKNHL